MKKYLIAILFLGYNLITFGQTGNTIIDTNRRWSIKIGVMYANPNPHVVEHTDYIKFLGDTIIGSKHYRSVVESQDSNMNSAYVYRYVREDSLKRVFMFINGFPEWLLYDFNASVGDNLTVGFRNNTIALINIDSVFIYDKYYKRFTFSSGESWIENIGSSAGVIYSGIPGSGWTVMTDLLCYYENDTLKYSPQSTCYVNDNIGMDEIAGDNISFGVFPNPVTSTSFIKIITPTNRKFDLDIFDCLGRKLKTFDIYFNNDIQITNSEFISGLYFYRLIDLEKSYLVGKFIVE